MKKMTPNTALFAVILAVNLRILNVTMFEQNNMLTPSIIDPLLIMVFALVIEAIKRILSRKKLLQTIEFQIFILSLKVRMKFSGFYKLFRKYVTK